jgi:hypothetical protein
VEHALLTYVALGIPALLGTISVLNRTLDLYERIERRRLTLSEEHLRRRWR